MNIFKRCGFKQSEPEISETPTINIVNILDKTENPVKVKVNNKATDLSINDVIIIGSGNDSYPITIGGIMVGSNGKISYLCETTVGPDVRTELMTLEEIKRLSVRSLF